MGADAHGFFIDEEAEIRLMMLITCYSRADELYFQAGEMTEAISADSRRFSFKKPA